MLKLLFGFIGYLITHSFFGGLFGFFAGWYVEHLQRSKQRNQQRSSQNTYRQGRTAEDIHNYYRMRSAHTSDIQTILIALSAAVMKADGKTLKIELNYIKSFFQQQFGDQFTADHLQKLKHYLYSDIPLTQICSDVRLQLRPQARLQVLSHLFKIAQVDQEISASELKVITNIAALIGVTQMDFEQIKKQFVGQSNERGDRNYQLLGLNKNASIQEVKTAYRKLSKKYHPDTVAHQGEDAQRKAKEQFQKIQAAYQTIIAQRK